MKFYLAFIAALIIAPGFLQAQCNPCEASFNIYYNDDCTITLVNTSVAAQENDCGDCDNPSGITSASWGIYEYHDGPFPYVSPYTGCNTFNCTFDPTGAGPNDGFQICLTIEDCSGCSDTYCEVLDRFAPCFGRRDNLAEGEREKLVPMSKDYILQQGVDREWLELQINTDRPSGSFVLLDMDGNQLGNPVKIDRCRASLNVANVANGDYVVAVIENGQTYFTERISIAK